MYRGAWQAIVHGLARVGHDLASEQHLTAAKYRFKKESIHK